MQKTNSGWKVLLAIFSLLLTVLIWQRGLQESFDRPSVSPKLALNQREMAILAAPSLPQSVSTFFIGEDPKLELKGILEKLEFEEISNREKLLLVLLQSPEFKENSFLENSFQETEFENLRKSILKGINQQEDKKALLAKIDRTKLDPLLYRLYCVSAVGNSEICFDESVSRNNALRLVLSQLIPLLATLIGIIIFLWQSWTYFRKKSLPWPDISALPLPLIDMIILISGGFVVLGELVTPLIAYPISDLLTREIESPIKESLKVFIGYLAMTIPPLVILRQQVKSIKSNLLTGDLFQWGFNFIPRSFLEALKGWLMVMPFVLLVSWLTTFFFGDPGGSNPLLEMVLSSRNFYALAVLLVTTVFVAPVFEEFIFRGVLLPVLDKEQNRFLAIIFSALIFALAHLSVGETPPLFVLGIGLALLRLSTGRLLPCVIMHSLWNGVTFANLLILSG